jgi:hypothetical protein
MIVDFHIALQYGYEPSAIEYLFLSNVKGLPPNFHFNE